MCLPINFCCCCVSLETGTQIISIGSTLVSTMLSVLYCFAAALPQQSENKMLFYGAMAVIATCHSVTGCFLIYGAFWNNHRCMWPWIILSSLWSVLMLVAAIAGFALLHCTDIDLDDDMNYIISAYIIFAGVMYYLALIVNSRRREMLQGKLFSAVKTWNPPAPAWSYTRTYRSWRSVDTHRSINGGTGHS